MAVFEVLAGGLVGGGFGLAATWISQRHAEREGNKVFERQRQLAREEHERQAAYEFSRELSLRLDNYLLWSDGLVGFLEFVLMQGLQIDDLEARNQAYLAVRKKLGVEEVQRYVTPDLFEDDELRALLTEHWKTAWTLENKVCLVEGPLPDRKELDGALTKLASLRSRVDIKRRELLRSARPL